MTNSSLLVIVGPTGAGKTALALHIAGTLRGEIVNFDSVQVYRGLNVGSAKTPTEQRQGIPHHLIDVASPSEDFSAGKFRRLAEQSLIDIAARPSLPILVGGTGFYLRSLLDGLSDAPERNPDLVHRLTEVALRRPAALHRFLRRVDPPAAARIHPNDHQKLIRAVELSTHAFATQPRQPLQGFDIIKIGLNPPRHDLYAKLNQRAAAMFASGLVEETKSLLEAGLDPKTKALQSLGYKQAVSIIEGTMTLPEAIIDLQTKTRQYAKRQMTWFRSEPNVHWLNGFGDQTEPKSMALLLLGLTASNNRQIRAFVSETGLDPKS